MDFIDGLPKVELHVHLEGTLEPELAFALAERNGITMPWPSPADLRAAYAFHDLPSFLAVYYAGMAVLHTEADFHDLAWAYFRKAAEQNIVYVEPFFDPQAHTRRGVPFDTVIRGIRRAQQAAAAELGVQSNLVMCFLRDMSAASAAEHLQMALPWRHAFVGVGLDSDEAGNPPSKFAAVFAEARAAGLRLTMHCDVNQVDSVRHIRECLDLIDVDRIDHGVNALDDPTLVRDIASRGLALTVCPVSNRFVVGHLTDTQIRALVAAGVRVTINSDDPAYFGGYLSENLKALRDDAGFDDALLAQLVRNAIDACWVPPGQRAALRARLDAYVADRGVG